MIKTILKWSILVVLVAYAAMAAVWAHGEAMKSACKGINIEISGGNLVDSVSQRGVMAELAGYPGKIIGNLPAYINTREIESYLRQFSHFEDVECNMLTDGRLNVRITPMMPALRVFDGNSSYYINKDGKVMESKASFFVDVPVVSGHFSENFTARQLMPVVKFVENDPMLSKLVGMIQANDPDNILLVPRIHGHVINFGDTTRLEEKTKMLAAVYSKVMPYKGWETYDTISVKFRGQIVASRKNKSRIDYGGVYDEETDLEEATLPDLSYPHEE